MIGSRLERRARSLAQRVLHSATKRVARKTVPLGYAIDARIETLTTDAGTLNMYVDRSGTGRPLVLLHSVNAAASAFEMRPLFDAFRGQRPVFALELPGFGRSQRSGLRFQPALYIRAIEHLLRNVAAETTGRRADIVALSLTSEFAACVATQLPDLLHSLVLISPTGFASEREQHSLERRARRGQRALLPGMLAKLGGEPLFRLLVSEPSLRYYLRKSFVGEVDSGLLEYAYLTSHQPHARHAPLAFLSGALFSRGDAKRNYANVRVPTLVLKHADGYTGFGELNGFVQRHPNYSAVDISQTRGLPQFEAPEATLSALRNFWEVHQHVETLPSAMHAGRGVPQRHRVGLML